MLNIINHPEMNNFQCGFFTKTESYACILGDFSPMDEMILESCRRLASVKTYSSVSLQVTDTSATLERGT